MCGEPAADGAVKKIAACGLALAPRSADTPRGAHAKPQAAVFFTALSAAGFVYPWLSRIRQLKMPPRPRRYRVAESFSSGPEDRQSIRGREEDRGTETAAPSNCRTNPAPRQHACHSDCFPGKLDVSFVYSAAVFAGGLTQTPVRYNEKAETPERIRHTAVLPGQAGGSDPGGNFQELPAALASSFPGPQGHGSVGCLRPSDRAGSGRVKLMPGQR